MEFYFRNYTTKNIINKFQFPTGWNSTISLSAIFIPLSVSIPNGMEFYFARSSY